MSDDPAVDVLALGSVVRVRWVEGASPQLLETFRRAWSRCLVADDDPDTELTAAVGSDGDALGEVNAVGRDEVEALEVATAGVTVLAIQELAGDRLMLHACALANPQTGKAVVLVGPSGAGKTTIAATHGRRWGYVTDETVAVDEGGAAVAYPKPLSVVTGDTKVQQSPDALGLLVSPPEVTVEKVLLLDRRSGEPQARTERVAVADAVALLAEHTSYLTRLDRPLGRLASLVQTSGGLDRVTYGECEQLAPLLDDLLGGPK